MPLGEVPVAEGHGQPAEAQLGQRPAEQAVLEGDPVVQRTRGGRVAHGQADLAQRVGDEPVVEVVTDRLEPVGGQLREDRPHLAAPVEVLTGRVRGRRAEIEQGEAAHEPPAQVAGTSGGHHVGHRERLRRATAGPQDERPEQLGAGVGVAPAQRPLGVGETRLLRAGERLAEPAAQVGRDGRLPGREAHHRGLAKAQGGLVQPGQELVGPVEVARRDAHDVVGLAPEPLVGKVPDPDADLDDLVDQGLPLAGVGVAAQQHLVGDERAEQRPVVP